MANKPQPPSLQDILRKRQQSEFVGRAQQLTDFRASLRYDVPTRLAAGRYSIGCQVCQPLISKRSNQRCTID